MLTPRCAVPLPLHGLSDGANAPEGAACTIFRAESGRGCAALLCSPPQGDRHSENAFITDDGGLKLIDTRDNLLSDSARQQTARRAAPYAACLRLRLGSPPRALRRSALC